MIFISLISICFIGLILYAFAALIKRAESIPHDLRWILEETPALFACVLFLIYSACISLLAVSLLSNVSNHIVQSLDILYLFSLIMLVLFHLIKESRVLLCK